LAVRFRERQDTTGTTGFAGADQLDEDDLSPRRKEKDGGVKLLPNKSLHLTVGTGVCLRKFCGLSKFCLAYKV
jgi:hypothetical protein